MMISDLAYREMEAGSQSILNRISNLLASITGRQPTSSRSQATSPERHSILILDEQTDATRIAPFTEAGGSRTTADGPEWRKHPKLRLATEPGSSSSPSVHERLVRAASTRAIFLARSRRYDEARSAFATAAADPNVDLGAIAGFWDLSRAGMQCAIDAYQDANRLRDAARLEATIRLTFRPRLSVLQPGSSRSATGG